ncbi:hypothetical protein DQ239_14665 [Blastococcus sp. TF02-09]|uniref:hypothetical protein n=1 Tax=Blastococcus sp. TF02-09 TaxID=2250576 RepID=UPI000DEB4B40|nr:hypothetical protein [Blastococcus sp. TF02-9]RBY76230.1 hypothetical protein DQ239_14665 [Blastococcus sp. TF02-9]
MLKLPITLPEIAPRISAGAFILNSGLSKRAADEQTAAGLHGFASGTYPFLQKVPPQQFVQGLSTAEIAVGAALLAPIVPTFTAGAVLTAFSGGLLGLYLKTPGMRKPGSLAPTEQGLAVAKDSWLVGIGIGLMTRGLVERRPRVTVKKAAKQAKRAAKQARREAKAAARA